MFENRKITKHHVNHRRLATPSALQRYKTVERLESNAFLTS